MSPRPLLLSGTPPGSQTTEWLEKNGVCWGFLGEEGKCHMLAGLPDYTARVGPLEFSMGTRKPDKGLCLFSLLSLGSGPHTFPAP